MVLAYCGFAVNLSFCSAFARSCSGVNRRGSSIAVKQTDATKDVHKLRQFYITKIATCTSCLDSLDLEMHNYCTGVAKVVVDLEALEQWVAVTESVLVQLGLREVRAEIQEINEKMTTL